MNLEDRKRNRKLFLDKLWEMTGGSTHKHVTMWDVGTSLGFDREETQDITRYLASEQLLKYRAMGGLIGLTHSGLKKMEGDEPDETLPIKQSTIIPPTTVIKIGTMVNSQLQQGTNNSKQELTVQGKESKPEDERTAGYKSGTMCLIIGCILGFIAYYLGWNLGGQIFGVVSLALIILAILCFVKPSIAGPIAQHVLNWIYGIVKNKK